jgi:hypothetical protein
LQECFDKLADMVLASSVAALFKWRQFEPEVIPLAVGWYLRFSRFVVSGRTRCDSGISGFALASIGIPGASFRNVRKGTGSSRRPA